MQAKPILIFIGKFLLAFIILSAIYQFVLNKPYTSLFGSTIKMIYNGPFGEDGKRDISLPGTENNDSEQIKAFLLDDKMIQKYQQARAAGQNVQFKPPVVKIDTWLQAGIYLVFFLSLVIATAANGKRALIAVGIGLLILHFFLVFKTGFRLQFEAANSGIGGTSLEGFGGTILTFLHNIFRLANFNLLIALLLWLFLAFRMEDFEKIKQRLFTTSN